MSLQLSSSGKNISGLHFQGDHWWNCTGMVKHPYINIVTTYCNPRMQCSWVIAANDQWMWVDLCNAPTFWLISRMKIDKRQRYALSLSALKLYIGFMYIMKTTVFNLMSLAWAHFSIFIFSQIRSLNFCIAIIFTLRLMTRLLKDFFDVRSGISSSISNNQQSESNCI